jgi:hypothetical protein
LGSSKITLLAHKSGPKKYHFIPNALVPSCMQAAVLTVGSVAATCWLLASFLSFAAGGFGGGGEGGDWRLLS